MWPDSYFKHLIVKQMIITQLAYNNLYETICTNPILNWSINVCPTACASYAHRTCTARAPHAHCTRTARASHAHRTRRSCAPHAHRTRTARAAHGTRTARAPNAHRMRTTRAPHAHCTWTTCSHVRLRSMLTQNTLQTSCVPDIGNI